MFAEVLKNTINIFYNTSSQLYEIYLHPGFDTVRDNKGNEW